MKYLLVLAVVLVAFYIWRNNRIGARQERDTPPPPPRKPAPPAIMLACRTCGTHLPESEAIPGRQGSYCSVEHRRQQEGA